MKKIVIISILVLIGLGLTWYFDLLHEPVEPISELLGNNYDNAHKMYFRTDPDEQYKININKCLNEFHSGISIKKGLLLDSIVYVFTWNFPRYKKTIWVGKTKELDNEVIDAIRYKDGVNF